MKNRFAYGVAAAALLFVAGPSATVAAAPAAPAMTEQQLEAAYNKKIEELERELRPRFGTIRIPAAKATLELGDSYYFLPAEDAKKVLVDAWGNPPEVATGVLGMVFPAGKNFYDGSWGAVVQYEETGHVKDEDAASEDFDAVLEDMKTASEAENEQLVEQGYPASHIIGWAQAPTYDARTKTLIWARNIKFDGTEENTLNYDVRTLGRTGVLSLNMVDVMPNLPLVRQAASGVGAAVRFDKGARYADFDPSSDAVAEYGLAGLVAAGAGLGLAKKAGILAVLAVILKKGFVFILAALGGAGVWLKRRFSSGYRDREGDGDA